MNDRERGIAARVRDLRRSYQVSQAHLAERIGVSRDQVANVEYGITPLYYRTGKAMCAAFGLSQRYLATGQEPLFPCAVIPVEIEQGIAPTALFSEAYDSVLRTTVERVHAEDKTGLFEAMSALHRSGWTGTKVEVVNVPSAASLDAALAVLRNTMKVHCEELEEAQAVADYLTELLKAARKIHAQIASRPAAKEVHRQVGFAIASSGRHAKTTSRPAPKPE